MPFRVIMSFHDQLWLRVCLMMRKSLSCGLSGMSQPHGVHVSTFAVRVLCCVFKKFCIVCLDQPRSCSSLWHGAEWRWLLWNILHGPRRSECLRRGGHFPGQVKPGGIAILLGHSRSACTSRQCYDTLVESECCSCLLVYRATCRIS